MALTESLRRLVDDEAPCVAVIATIRTDEPADGAEGSLRSSVEFASSADGLELPEIAHALAALKFAYSLACERYAESLGIPQNALHSLINEHYNTMDTRER
jgi:hypothetical protein